MYTFLLLVALGAAAYAFKTASAAAGRIERLESDLRYKDSAVTNLKEELSSELKVLKGQVAALAAGKGVNPSMVLEGRLYDDIDGAKAYQIFKESPGSVVVDVRTYDEWRAGHVAGAIHIPVDQIEKRFTEVPKDAPNVIVHCAAGARSSAACEFLANAKGYTNLHNVAGSIFHGWPEKPETAA
ncbi:MAG: rhodanese-like domain-containing protein [Deltaproteobacteria bacterium]|nr:rhodanese-like domain-containing protein [Deltaproteobacteria bacterium]